MTTDTLGPFLLASAVIALVPGQDTLLTLRFALAGNRAGFVYAAAVCLGILLWAVLALTGVSAALQASPAAFAAVRIAGGAYLCFLGVRAAVPAALLLRSVRREPSATALGMRRDRRGAAASGAVFRTGVISSLTNAKTGLFFLALLPGFVPPRPGPADFALLAAAPAVATLLVLSLTTLLAVRIGRLLADPCRSAALDLVFGIVFCVLGITVLTH